MSQHDRNSLADRLEGWAAKASPRPWRMDGIPYVGNDDPVIIDANGVYVAQTVYDMQSITQEHPVDDDTIFIVEIANNIETVIAALRAQSGENRA